MQKHVLFLLQSGKRTSCWLGLVGQRCENVVQGFGVKTSTWCSELGSAQFLLQTKGAVSGRICKMSDHELIRAVETLVPY